MRQAGAVDLFHPTDDRCGVPVGAGTDAARVASHNPFVFLHWLVSGKPVGGSWFSSEDGKKGSPVPGPSADPSVLSGDFFSAPVEQINRLKSVLTVVDGRDPRRVCARRRGAVVHQAAAIQSAAGYPAFPDEVQAGSEFGLTGQINIG